MKKIKLILLSILFALTSCKTQDSYKLTIVSPSGAPAIAIADLAYNHKEEYNFELNKTPEILQATFLGNQEDVIIAPINMGATMYNKNGNYLLASTLTWGNLYFASRLENFTLETMNNKEVIFFGANTINQYVVDKVLEHNSIVPSNKVFLETTALTQGQLIAKEDSIVLIAEPALSVAKTKVQGITSISVQDLYKDMTNGDSYPQAGCFVRKQTVKDHKSKIDSFISALEESSNKTSSDTETIAQYAEELEFGGKKPILINAIPNCNIKFVSATDSKLQINSLFVNATQYCGGKLPDDNFYYQK